MIVPAKPCLFSFFPILMHSRLVGFVSILWADAAYAL